jgi:hypothetical protein
VGKHTGLALPNSPEYSSDMRNLTATICLKIVIALPTAFMLAPVAYADSSSKAGQRVSKGTFLKHFVGVTWIGSMSSGTAYVGIFKKDGTFEVTPENIRINTGTWKIDDSGTYCQKFDSGWSSSCWYLEYSDKLPGFKSFSTADGQRSYIEKSINGDSYFERLVLGKTKPD